MLIMSPLKGDEIVVIKSCFSANNFFRNTIFLYICGDLIFELKNI